MSQRRFVTALAHFSYTPVSMSVVSVEMQRHKSYIPGNYKLNLPMLHCFDFGSSR